VVVQAVPPSSSGGFRIDVEPASTGMLPVSRPSPVPPPPAPLAPARRSSAALVAVVVAAVVLLLAVAGVAVALARR
jgi:hypothetical protein